MGEKGVRRTDGVPVAMERREIYPSGGRINIPLKRPRLEETHTTYDGRNLSQQPTIYTSKLKRAEFHTCVPAYTPNTRSMEADSAGYEAGGP